MVVPGIFVLPLKVALGRKGNRCALLLGLICSEEVYSFIT